MADEYDVRVERIKTAGIVGVAIISALGGWMINSLSGSKDPEKAISNPASKNSLEIQKTTLTYFIPPAGMNKNDCVDTIAARLSLAKFLYDFKGGTQGRTIGLHWDGSSAFVYCIPKRDGSDITDVVVAGAAFIPTRDGANDAAPDWQRFIHVIEGSLVQR